MTRRPPSDGPFTPTVEVEPAEPRGPHMEAHGPHAARDRGRDPRGMGAPAHPRRLLVLVVLVWAVSWPVIKVGVASVPPIWYGALRYLLAAGCLFAFAALRRELALPPRSDWPLVAVSALLQMSAFSALVGTALTVLPPGRASVLAYSTPIWVTPLSAWWLHERLTRAALLGVGLGLLGVVVIAAPSLHSAGSRPLAAYGMLLGAAAAWAISIVFVRRHRFTASALALAPWQALLSAALLLLLATLLEGAPPPIGAGAAASLAYVGPVATAFAYWAVVEAGRHVRASTLSMALLATPGLGILLSAATLGEAIGPSLIAGVLLIGAGVRLATQGIAPPSRCPASAATRRSKARTSSWSMVRAVRARVDPAAACSAPRGCGDR